MEPSFRVIVVGLGIQGYKRRQFAGQDFVAAVDPLNKEAQYRSVEDVPLAGYEAALVCIPDEPKVELLTYLLSNSKHVLVEKPLWAAEDRQIERLEQLARAKGVVCYTAYNHRFEPHFVRMRRLIESGDLGRLYRCRMFYGNGTARLVRDSLWRDQGAGVLPVLVRRARRGILHSLVRLLREPVARPRRHWLAAHRTPARAGDDFAVLAKPLYLRCFCREWVRPYQLAL